MTGRFGKYYLRMIKIRLSFLFRNIGSLQFEIVDEVVTMYPFISSIFILKRYFDNHSVIKTKLDLTFLCKRFW